jgi:hypothetical protein
VFDTVRIKTKDEQTALTLAREELARFRPELVRESETEWELRLESESDDDLPDLLGILYARLNDPAPSIELLINGEHYSPHRGD